MDKTQNIIRIIKKQLGENVKANVLIGDVALAAMRRYVEEESAFRNNVCAVHDPGKEEPTEPDYDVLGLYEYRDGDYYAVILPRDAEIDPSTFLFVTGFMPFMPDVWISRGRPCLQKMFFNEVTAAHELGFSEEKSPLFITGSYELEMIPAWDLRDKFPLFIEGYKTYRDTFTVIYENGREENTNGNYCVYVPSENFRILTGIHCSPELLSRKLPWEEWEKRPFHIPEKDIKNTLEEFGLDFDLYQQALNLLNDSYKSNKGNPQTYAKLETRLYSFEKLLHLKAPEGVLKNSQKLLLQSVNSLV